MRGRACVHGRACVGAHAWARMRVCAIGERTHAHRKTSYGVAQRVLCRMVLTRDAEGTIKHMPNAKLAIFSTASPSACPLRIALHRTAHCLLGGAAGTAVLPYLPTYLPTAEQTPSLTTTCPCTRARQGHSGSTACAAWWVHHNAMRCCVPLRATWPQRRKKAARWRQLTRRRRRRRGRC